MYWNSQFLALFEQTAATRATSALMQLTMALPADGMLDARKMSGLDRAQVVFEREDRRHRLWLDRRMRDTCGP